VILQRNATLRKTLEHDVKIRQSDRRTREPQRNDQMRKGTRQGRVQSRAISVRRSTARRDGRPSTAAAIRNLVGKMAAANPLWGAPQIHGELGIEVSERTVSRLLRPRRRPPSQTWRTFLTNHVASLVSIAVEIVA
jgi:hypothetical protein